MTGTLFVVATPIGHLEDITVRALRVLREVALVAAEDTRRTGNLLRHYDITTPLVSVHEHNEQRRRGQLVARLEAGESIALVSDAGTPAISDPGARIVRAAREAGIRVEPVPGPSAITAALSVSGFDIDRFFFAGFPPIRADDRRRWMDLLRTLEEIPVVCFEAPHRIARTLEELRLSSGKRPILIGREVTKAHEQWTLLPPEASALPEITEKGEFVLVLGPVEQPTRRQARARPAPPDEEVLALFSQITKDGAPSRKAAIRMVAARLNLPVKSVYNALERAKPADPGQQS
jgi:16S rRNA (cytidine1402-2'-O)-methyltransferase